MLLKTVYSAELDLVTQYVILAVWEAEVREQQVWAHFEQLSDFTETLPQNKNFRKGMWM